MKKNTHTQHEWTSHTLYWVKPDTEVYALWSHFYKGQKEAEVIHGDRSLEVATSGHGTSLVVQWLRLCASTSGGAELIPGGGTKIPHATGHSQINKLISF